MTFVHGTYNNDYYIVYYKSSKGVEKNPGKKNDNFARSITGEYHLRSDLL